MKIAVVGCSHGELDPIYDLLQFIEAENGVKAELLLICGDFQAVRNNADFYSMAVPPKFRKLNTFYKYYSGEKTAPVPTIIIGGNHEASNFMQELPYGGWIAPNIYYLGFAGCVQFRGLRIAGMSGIYKHHDYHRGHFEHPPYNNSSLRSVYHTRQIDVWRLKHLSPIDIFLSHDWPTGIWEHGDVNALLHRKPFFRDDIQSYRLGSAAAAELLEQLQPNYWFSAHLHVRFAAYLRHKSGANTRFLALDKVLPGRRFLQLLDVESRSDEPLSLDPEWLCILRNTDSAAVPSHAPVFLPPISKPTEEEIAEIRATFMDTFRLPENFERTAPTLSEEQNGSKPASWYSNPQTELLCKMVGLRRPFGAPTSLAGMHLPPPSKNPDEIVLDDDDGNNDDDEMVEGSLSKKTETSAPIANPDEIPLGDSDEEQQNE